MSRSLLIFLSVFFILLPSSLQAQDGSFEEASTACTRETDEFKQQTLIRCDPLSVDVEEQPGESIYRARIVLSRVDGQAFLLVHTVSESWNFLDVDTAYALIDGENYEFRFARVEREVNSGQVTEQNAMVLDAPALDSLASASEVRVKLGQAVLRLPAGKLAAHVRALRSQ